MPIVVKLSHAFYDRFGDDIVDELVGVLNQVDAASHQSLRDLNEANWSRFEDRLARGLAEVHAEVAAILHREIAGVDGKIAGVDAKIAGVDARIAGVDARISAVDVRISAVDVRIANLHAKLSAQLVTHMRWMIGMWAATMLGLWFKR